MLIAVIVYAFRHPDIDDWRGHWSYTSNFSTSFGFSNGISLRLPQNSYPLNDVFYFRLAGGIMESREEAVKRLAVLVTVLLLLVGFILSSVSDADTSGADTRIPDNELTSSIGEANNSSASTTITITWTTAPLPDE